MRRRTSAGFALVALAVAAIVVLLVAGPFRARPDRPIAGPAPAPTTTLNPQVAPSVPARGAYFGAWVRPVIHNQRTRIAMVNALQRQIGRRLDIVHIYLLPDALFPTRSDLAFLHQGSMLMVSWALSDTRGIIAGKYDSLIRQRAEEMKAVGKPIFLRWREEMNRPNLRYVVHSAADFVAAWKHIRAIFAQQHVANVAWVWCPTSRGFASTDAGAFYPGDDEVDWVCTDAYPGPGPYRPFR